MIRINKLKNNNGISLLALIITIIVIIILASIVGVNMAKPTEKATIAKVLNEFIEVENAVAIQGKLAKVAGGNYRYYGISVESMGKPYTINGITYSGNYYLLTKDDLVMLGINSAPREYLVNYETGDVIAVQPFMIKDKPIYKKIDLIYEETDYSVTGMAEYDDVKGVNKPMLFSGMLPVKRDGSNWVVCSRDDNEWYDYSITSSGPVRYANVMLLDDITLVNPDTTTIMSNSQIRSKRPEDLVGFIVEKEGSMFIWIPRYTYKPSTNEIVYSKLTSDFLDLGYEKAPAFHYGEVEAEDGQEIIAASGKELTGIWISKYQASYAN